MFDFMKDFYLEINGFDMEKVKEERKQKLEKEKAETIIFKKKTKKYFLIVGAILLIISVLGLAASSGQSQAGVIKNTLIILLDVATMICMVIHKKETEVASLIGMVLIALIEFFLPI